MLKHKEKTELQGQWLEKVTHKHTWGLHLFVNFSLLTTIKTDWVQVRETEKILYIVKDIGTNQLRLVLCSLQFPDLYLIQSKSYIEREKKA